MNQQTKDRLAGILTGEVPLDDVTAEDIAKLEKRVMKAIANKKFEEGAFAFAQHSTKQ